MVGRSANLDAGQATPALRGTHPLPPLGALRDGRWGRAMGPGIASGWPWGRWRGRFGWPCAKRAMVGGSPAASTATWTRCPRGHGIGAQRVAVGRLPARERAGAGVIGRTFMGILSGLRAAVSGVIGRRPAVMLEASMLPVARICTTRRVRRGPDITQSHRRPWSPGSSTPAHEPWPQPPVSRMRRSSAGGRSSSPICPGARHSLTWGCLSDSERLDFFHPRVQLDLTSSRSGMPSQ